MLSTEELISKIKLVNDKWLLTEPWKENTNWATACYFMGCLDAYEETGEKRYLDAAVRWGEEHDWRACVEGNLDYARDVLVNHFTVEGRLDWKFDDIADYLNIHADHLTCGGTFLKLKKYVPEKANIDSIKRIMDFMINDPHVDYWWWVDTIHMALCIMHKVTEVTGDERYADKAHALYMDTKSRLGLYDTEEHLWHRDWRYLPENGLTKNGKKIFWSRGNGWAYAGLIQTMEQIGREHRHYAEYEKTFLEMTDALMKCRGKDGFWRASLHDADEFPMIETSGTLLFLSSILKAVRLGVLDESYLAVFEESFDAMNEHAVFEDGTIGWVQGVAGSPGETLREGTRDYAVGYYLMTCCECLRFIRERKEQ